MDFKHLSDSELAKNTESPHADSERKRNISAESYLTGKMNMRSTRDGSTNNNQRNDELSTFGRNPDACPRTNPEDQSGKESPPPLPTEIGSTLNELAESPNQDGKLLNNSDPIEADSTRISDIVQDSTPRKPELQISIADSDESSDFMIETGDFIMDLSPIERTSENMFFDADKPDGVHSDNYDIILMEETSKLEDDSYGAAADVKEIYVGRSSASSCMKELQASQDSEEINMQEQLKERPKDDQGVGGSTRPETSSPYSSFDNNAGVGDSIIGQPRCVALKHGFVNLDSLEELDFDFEFIEDEPNEVGGKRAKKVLEDMFQDDDDSEVEGVLKHSNAEIEEGELTPDVNSSSQQIEGKESNSKRKNLVESNLDFFSKVNRCFSQLDKEFNNIRVPRNCKKLIGQLQDTLRIVRRMDRKLSVLIDSVDKKDRRVSRSSATCEPRNSSKDYDVPLGKKYDDKFDSPDYRSGRQRERRRDSSKCEEQSTSKRRSRDSEESRSTRKSTPSEGKKEKQRIQSLFKRQMSLITRHVIQRNRDMKKREVKSGKFPSKDASINRDASEKVKDLSEMKTLEDMEAFLQMLKDKKHRKPDGSGSRDHGGLKFTTKKTTNSEWRAILEKAREETKNKMAASILPCSIPSAPKETPLLNSVGIKENGRKMDEETLKNGKEWGSENSIEKQTVKYDSNKPFDAIETANLWTLKNSEEQRWVNRTKEGEKERSVERVELQNGEKVNDSLLVKREKSEEIRSIREVSDFESDSGPKKSIRKRTKKWKHSKLKSSSESGSSSELKDQIPPTKKRKRSRSSKLPPKNDAPWISSKTRYHSAEEEIDYSEDRSGEINPQNLFVVADKSLSLLDKHFYVTVKGNQIFLATKDDSDEETIRRRRKKNERRPRKEEEGTTWKEMEDFLQRLRSKKEAAQDQSKEAKFIARIQAKRKAKLMACISGTPTITEKEAKVLKDLETRDNHPCDSPETLSKKQELLQKIRAETEAIVTSSHQKKMDDPVRSLLTTMETEDKPQISVSFPLKKSSEGGRKESAGEGKAVIRELGGLSGESQKFLNSVRARMRAKKMSRKAAPKRNPPGSPDLLKELLRRC